MKERGLSRDQVAEGIDAHPITVSNLISGKTPLNTKWLERLGAVFNVPPDQILAARPSVRVVEVKSHVQAGEWSETNEWPDDDWYDVAVPDDPLYRNLALYGRETRGPSMNKRYPERSVLVHTSIHDTSERLEVGKRYIVEREKPDGTRETTVKTLSRDELGRLWLMPESSDPRYQAPIPLDEDTEAMVRVVGRVVYSVQRED